MAVQALLESFAKRQIDLDLSSSAGVDLLAAAVNYSAVQGGDDILVTSFTEKTDELEMVDWHAELRLTSQCGALEGATFSYCGAIDGVLIDCKMPNGNKLQTGMEGPNDTLRKHLKERSLL